jgi:beta-glucan synthesis-associated protein KRE6
LTATQKSTRLGPWEGVAATMGPSRPPPPRLSSRESLPYVDAVDDRVVSQAGRSPANIAAQASAQSLREASRPNSRPNSRGSPVAPNLLRKKSKPSSQNGDAIRESALPPPVPRHGQPYDPAVHSPLHGGLSSRSSDGSINRKNSDESSAGASGSTSSSGRSKTATAAGTALAAQMAAEAAASSQSATPRQPLLRPPEMSQNDSNLSLTRQTTPRTVRDLGSDYTRYFNPFSSRNNSQQDLSTPLPRYNSSSHLMTGAAGGVSSADLQKRLSNPFHDTKRLSNPFDSRPQTSPGTPLQRQESSEENGRSSTAAMAAAPMVPPPKPGTPAFIRDADPEKMGFFPYMDDRLGAPSYSFPLFSDQKEDDDDMHMPQWDDDKRLKPKFKDHFTRENIVSTFGLFFMILGLLTVFVVLPAISYTGHALWDYPYDTPLSEMPKSGPQPETWATVNNRTYDLLENVRTGLIDPDTPSSAKTRKGVNGDTYNLVFSDEFNAKNRTFYKGDDPFWFGLDAWYGATQDLEWYDPDAINTGM